ncbi:MULTISPECIES: hypothetical protein [unclassified Streptomyces]
MLSAHEDLTGFVREFSQVARELRLDHKALAELLGDCAPRRTRDADELS